MEVSVGFQLFVFVSSMLCGVIVGFLFDLFRIIRNIYSSGSWSTAIQDILFWVIAGFVVFRYMMIANNGEMRFYAYAAIALGTVLYFTFISKTATKIFTVILFAIHKSFEFVLKMLFMPVVFIFKLFKRPFFLVVNFGKKNFRNVKGHTSTSVRRITKFLKKM